MVYFSLKLYLISYLQLTFPLRQFIDRFWIYFALYKKKIEVSGFYSTFYLVLKIPYFKNYYHYQAWNLNGIQLNFINDDHFIEIVTFTLQTVCIRVYHIIW